MIAVDKMTSHDFHHGVYDILSKYFVTLDPSEKEMIISDIEDLVTQILPLKDEDELEYEEYDC